MKFYYYLDRFVYTKNFVEQFLWNYSKLIKNNGINENNYFVINNIFETTNKILNEDLSHKNSSFINFRNSVLSTDLYL